MPDTQCKPPVAYSRNELILAALLYAIAAYLVWSVLEHWLRIDIWGNYDNRNYHPDMIAYGMKRLAAGDWPSWNPHQSAGLPFFAALQGMVLYPPTWLAMVFSGDTAHVVSKFLHLFVSGFSLYFYLRVLKLQPLASFLGGLFFMTGNFYLVFTVFEAGAYPLATVGFLLAAVEKILQTSSRAQDAVANRWSLVFLATMVLQVFAGYIQTVVYIGYFLCLYIPFRLGQCYLDKREFGFVVTVFTRFAVMAVLAVLLCAVQLLPTLEMSSNSSTHNLVEGMDLAYVNVPIIPSPTVAETLNDPVVPMTQSYRDALFWCLVAAGLLFSAAHRPLAAFYFLATLLFVTMARGPEAWLFKFYFYYVPTGSWFRWPEKFLLLSNLTVSVLVGVGLHHCQRFIARRDWRLAGYGFWGYCFAVFAIAFLARYTTAGAQITYPNWHWKPFGKDYSAYQPSRAWYGLQHMVQHPAQFKMHLQEPYTEAQAVLAFLRRETQQERTLALLQIDLNFMPDLPIKWAMREGLYSIEDYEPLNTARFVEFGQAMGLNPFYHKSIPRNRKLLSLFGARWILVSQNWLNENPGQTLKKFKRVYRDEHYQVFELPTVIPRSFVASAVRSLPEQEILPYLSQRHFDPQVQVVLDEAAVVGAYPESGSLTAATIVEYQPERVVIELPEVTEGGVLVLTDSFDSNWRVTVDGEPADLLAANHLFRAVEVSAGSRRVEFDYYPLTVYIGAAVSLATAALIALFGFATRRRETLSR